MLFFASRNFVILLLDNFMCNYLPFRPIVIADFCIRMLLICWYCLMYNQ